MRRHTGMAIPVSIISAYYAVVALVSWWIVRSFPGLDPYLPIGATELLGREVDQFEQIQTMVESSVDLSGTAVIRLGISLVGTVVLMVPISWVYVLTTRSREVEPSFLQTIVVLPIVVTGIAMIVQNSLALAFSLAGIVAAVRFRFSLDKPSHALYIFAAIGVGLGAGIGGLDIALISSLFFVYVTLVLWRLNYGASLGGPFIAFFSGRDRDEEDD